jgi:hypothetical protein
MAVGCCAEADECEHEVGYSWRRDCGYWNGVWGMGYGVLVVEVGNVYSSVGW